MSSAIKSYTKLRLKLLSSLLLVLVLLLPPLVNMFISKANAGTLTNYKLQINNSQAAATGVTYSFNWTTAATTAIKQIDIQICTTPSGVCTAPSGFASNASAGTLASDNIAGATRTVSAPTANAFRIVVTTPAAQSTQSMFVNFTGVTNPSTINTSYYARTTTYSDAGITPIDGTTTAAFAVLDTSSIAVSASVDAAFTFAVAGVASGANFNGGTANVNVTSTANTIPFGTLAAGTPKIAAQDVSITTNSLNGYTVTASHSAQTPNGPLVTATGNHKIDAFSGTNSTPTTWSAPAGSTPDTNTGYFGYSTEDATLCTGTAARFTSGGPKWAGSTTVGQELICNASAVTSETTRIGWEIATNALQPSGSYTGTVILIATPTY